ncbi:MAG: DUF928 domain-containing protein [Cyanobacteriota bacterium]|nr:DUF928 domain-containing protein [Cyanobacteriota bacterium]
MKYLPFIRAIGTTILVAGTTVFYVKTLNVTAVNAVTFEPPDAASPERSSGGASRGNSGIQVQTETEPPAILALLPKGDRGTTELEHPTVLIYLSQTLGEEAIFTLLDEDNNLHYQMSVPHLRAPGVIAIHLPEDAPALDIGRSYQWSVDVQDSDKAKAISSAARGWIERVETDSSSTDVWYDRAAELARLRVIRPNDVEVERDWQNLLGTIGLDEISSAAIVEVR